MSSPRSMFSGVLSLGQFVNIPIDIGKATGEEREKALIEVCDHSDDGKVVRIDRSERCGICGGPPQRKAMGVVVDEDKFRIFDANEMAQIEESTKTPILEVLDVQSMAKLPMMFAQGTYYIRFHGKSKQQPTAFATLVAAMMQNKVGLIVKWGNSSRQKLCVISAESGVLILRQLPFLSDVRIASDKERAHFKARPSKSHIEKMSTLLDELSNSKGFKWGEYQDDGLSLRQAAVERILAGEEPKEKPEPEQEFSFDDFENMMDKAIEDARK